MAGGVGDVGADEASPVSPSSACGNARGVRGAGSSAPCAAASSAPRVSGVGVAVAVAVVAVLLLSGAAVGGGGAAHRPAARSGVALALALLLPGAVCHSAAIACSSRPWLRAKASRLSCAGEGASGVMTDRPPPRGWAIRPGICRPMGQAARSCRPQPGCKVLKMPAKLPAAVLLQGLEFPCGAGPAKGLPVARVPRVRRDASMGCCGGWLVECQLLCKNRDRPWLAAAADVVG